eukprot:NODE_111_length_2627_cov_56.035600_g107_i0.p1 GENE.NODE_111_length_2627_cov_56.035600_g107_i0~~NODE_111_length_2627_cov_56.035600_g107_i0.p1  ORF type:complete len:809 (+),score=251.06 NODE_111_length_2627_cov_56.035600_g107_i0:332-2428(+)
MAAAQTGSGKTLAFGVPIVHHILRDIKRGKNLAKSKDKRLAMALVLSPTRELTMQLNQHIEAICKKTQCRTVPIVGGISEDKQKRLLGYRPHIICATPGRLMQLLQDQVNEFLSRSISTSLRYLVLDELDRLMQDKHFPELDDLFSRLARTSAESSWDSAITLEGLPEHINPKSAGFQLMTQAFTPEEWKSQKSQQDRQKHHAKEVAKLMATTLDYRKQMEQQAQEAAAVSGNTKKGKKRKRNEDEAAMVGAPTKLNPWGAAQGAARMVFVTSATLSLDPKFSSAARRKRSDKELTAATQMNEFLQRLGAQPSSFTIVDTTMQCSLPTQITQEKLECLDKDKDMYVYLFCATRPGRTVVFVNSIHCAKRLASLLKVLQLPAFALHASMQQRQRLKNLDRLKNQENCIIVATDVLGRGIDVTDIKHVIHYQFPRTTDTYVHRTGRTARASKEGYCLSMISPGDREAYKKVCFSLGLRTGLPPHQLSATQITVVRPRVAAAQELESMVHAHDATASKDKWAEDTAELLGVGLDESQIKGNRDPHAEKVYQRKVKRLRAELDEQLARPLPKVTDSDNVEVYIPGDKVDMDEPLEGGEEDTVRVRAGREAPVLTKQAKKLQLAKAQQSEFAALAAADQRARQDIRKSRRGGKKKSKPKPAGRMGKQNRSSKKKPGKSKAKGGGGGKGKAKKSSGPAKKKAKR